MVLPPARGKGGLMTLASFLLLLLWSCMETSPAAAFNVSTMAFDEGFTHLFGNDNLVRSSDGRSARLILNRYSGSGFISSDLYDHGFFSAAIKLPADYSAGVVVAFYTSNGDIFEKTHDELDFEFLGNIRGKEWRIQTNIYGNGSTNRGREERYLLPFDPTEDFHTYSILWTSDYILFYIDNVPIREVIRNEEMGGDYPSKPMAVYATLWDGSTWATGNGKYKVNYKYSPFISEFTDLVLQGCRADPLQQQQQQIDDSDPFSTSSSSSERCADADENLMAADFALMTPKKRAAMRRFRERYMTYSVCYDVNRYPDSLPECDIIPTEQSRFFEWGETRYLKERRRIRRPARRPKPSDPFQRQGVAVKTKRRRPLKYKIVNSTHAVTEWRSFLI